MEDFELPQLHPFVRIYPTNNKFNGEPQWTLHHTMTNKFFKIGWKEFECISRFYKYETAQILCDKIKQDIALDITLDELKSLILFLNTHHLLKHNAVQDKEKQKSIFSKMLHGYLYFTVPLIKPQKFLDRYYPFIRPLLDKTFGLFIIMLLCLGFVMTLPRIDEFLNTFSNIFTMEGAFSVFISFAFIKIIHEFSHAFMAKKYGVHVPHMGIAFIVMYPVLYTDATDAWKLKDKYPRVNIGMAGIYAEIAIAAIALIFWNFTSPGLLQMILFSIVTISLVGSLFINLNPLMRFDGYYVLSDLSGIDNLHMTAIDFARNKIRRILFGLQTPLSYQYPQTTQSWLIFFGFMILIYRFFLFIGIAILVYNVFMKPIGLIAMMIELVWFIGLPIKNEIKIWWDNRHDIINNIHGRVCVGVFTFMALLCLVPISSLIHASAVINASQYRVYYPEQNSSITNIYIENGMEVSKGDLLISLSSPTLEKDLRLAKVKLEKLQSTKRREQTNIDLYRSKRGLIDQQIAGAQNHYNNLKKQYSDLQMRADFDGVISDFSADIQMGQTVNQKQKLFLLSNPNHHMITAYVRENDISRIHIGDKAHFRNQYDLISSIHGHIIDIESINTDVIDFPILSTDYGGQILTHFERDKMRPVHALYRVKIKPFYDGQEMNRRITPGVVQIYGENRSVFSKIYNYFMQLFVKNMNFN